MTDRSILGFAGNRPASDGENPKPRGAHRGVIGHVVKLEGGA